MLLGLTELVFPPPYFEKTGKTQRPIFAELSVSKWSAHSVAYQAAILTAATGVILTTLAFIVLLF